MYLWYIVLYLSSSCLPLYPLWRWVCMCCITFEDYVGNSCYNSYCPAYLKVLVSYTCYYVAYHMYWDELLLMLSYSILIMSTMWYVIMWLRLCHHLNYCCSLYHVVILLWAIMSSIVLRNIGYLRVLGICTYY